MSVQAMSWVIDHSKHKENTFLVLLVIANHAKSDGTLAWPSIPVIAKEARCSEKTVQRAIKSLCESGELQIDKEYGPKNSRIYSLPLFRRVDKMSSLEGTKCPDRVDIDDLQGGHLRPANKEEPSLMQPSNSKAFVRPTLEEVASYCKSRNNSVDPQKWLDYYTSNGFRVGRTAMKDWQAAVRTWEKNGFSNGGNGDSHKTAAELRRERSDRNIAEAFAAIGDADSNEEPVRKGTLF